MKTSGSSITLMLLVDALRPDYLRHAPYLRGLAKRSATGALRECFYAEEFGFTNMFCFDPENSPFRIAHQLPAELAPGVRREVSGSRQLVNACAQNHLSYFAKNYGSSVEIPLPYAPYFDLVERRAPWDRDVGYRSCFAILDEHNLPWMQWMWPDTNKLPDSSDRGITDRVIKDLKPEHRLLCVHLQELDSLGHAYGPESTQLQQGVQATDEHIKRLIETLREKYESVKIVLFGDHGMVNVTRPLDVAAALEGTGLTFGVDYGYFLDSTMARLWFFHDEAREKVAKALQPLKGGRLLDADEMEHYEIAGCDRRNAEAVFLAEPGVLIFPNFFQAKGNPIPGMHGYDPDCEDNLGFFMLHDESLPDLAGQALGKVDPPAIFPLLLRSVGLDAAAFTKVAIPEPKPAEARGGRYTLDPSPEADEIVQGHLDRIVEGINKRVGSVEAVVLTGSFGRGEGGVYRDANGTIHPVNDYDLVVVDRRNLSGQLKTLGSALAQELNIDFVDLGWNDGNWSDLPLTIFNYDLKYGSMVIAGDETVFDRLPAYASANLPVYEFVRLLLNRTAGLLSGMQGDWFAEGQPTAEQQRYLTNQVIKALLALGDWHLWKWKGYDSSYAKRRERFKALAKGAEVSPDLIAAVDMAYAVKCNPDYAKFSRGCADVADIFPYLADALVSSVGVLTGRPKKTLGAAMESYLALFGANTPALRADNHRLLGQRDLRGLKRAPGNPVNSFRHSINAALPLLLESAQPEFGSASSKPASDLLGVWFELPRDLKSPAENWEALRSIAVRAWFSTCH